MIPLDVVLNSISEGFALLDSDFRIVDMNPEALRLIGRKREELVGKTHWEAFPGSESSELGRLYKSAMHERHTVEQEHHYAWDDQRFSWLNMRANPVEGGGLAIFFRDVSERHANEERLRQSVARFKAAVDATQGVVWTNDASGRMVGEQPGWAKLTGQSFEDYQGYGWSNAVHPDDSQPTVDSWNAAVAARTPFKFEHRLIKHDGTWRRFSISAIPILDNQGEIHEWVGVHNDITEADEARLQLARNAKTFEALVRNNPFGIYVVDAQFRLLHISHGAKKVFSTIESPLGRDLADILRLIWNEPFATEAINRFKTTLETGEPYVSLSTIESRADIDVTEAYDWRIERIALPDGTDGVVCYFYDLSERMKLEDDLRQALDQKDLLTREIEHRVQNSLSIVAGILRMQQSTVEGGEAKEALAAASLRVLAIGRIHKQLYKGNDVRIVEFGQYLRQLCLDVELTLGRSSLSFVVKADIVELEVDVAVPLGIVANELLTNACKHCDGGSDQRVSVMLTTHKGIMTLTIANTGPGMPADFSPNVNTGLGLKVIKNLIRQIDGTLVYPNAGHEARFEISVPLRSNSS